MYVFLMFINAVFLFIGIVFFRDYSLYFIVPGFLMVAWSQLNISLTFNHWSKIDTDLSGAEMARMILKENGIDDVRVKHTFGSLSDHYDPMKRVVRLSDSTYNSRSIAAVAVAAHEVGHAIQHHKGYIPLTLRNTFVPVVNVASTLWSVLIFAGFFFGLPYLLEIGIGCYGAFFAFAVLTLPVEFDASRRAIECLQYDGSLVDSELKGAKKVLNAAAMTYVAGALMTLLQLLRLLYIFNNRNE